MNKLSVKSNFPIGIAWIWVKNSFIIFREKPVNFMFFALCLVMFSALPFMGAFFASLVLTRIMLSANYVKTNQYFGLGLNFGLILRQRNILSLAIFNIGFDLVLMSIMSEFLKSWNISSESTNTILSDSRVMYLFFGISVFRLVFFGIAPAIITFNPQVGIISALKLSWQFIAKNFATIVFAMFLLVPILLIPLYIIMLLAISVTSGILFGIIFMFMFIFALFCISIMTIFSVNIYQDGISYETN